MRCWQCGRPLRDDWDVCSWCGATQQGERQPSAARPNSDVPVAAYAPSPEGPPVIRDISMPRASQLAPLVISATPAVVRRRGYQPVVLPPAPPAVTRRGGWFSRAVLAALALFAVLGLAAGLVARGGNVPIPGLAALRARPTAMATATAAPACKPAAVTYTATPALGSLQLTTALKNGKQKDYRPVNDVSRFTVGQVGYVTFQVLSTHAGTANVVVCTPGHRFTGHPVQVPAGSAGLYVEFPLSFDSSDVGQGMVTISWDGAVIANQGFTVAR